jgi:hypothetical protein
MSKIPTELRQDDADLKACRQGRICRPSGPAARAAVAAHRIGQKRVYGRFVAGFDDRRKMRIWRVE